MMRIVKLTLLIGTILLLALTVYSDDDVESTATPSKNELLNQELLSEVNTLMQADEDCQLPCFWSLVAGNSSLRAVKAFWTSAFSTPIETILSDDGRVFATFYTNFVPRNARTDIVISMTFKEDVLWLLGVSTANTEIWLEGDRLSLENILRELDDNSEFFIGIRQDRIVLIFLNLTSNVMVQKSYRFQANVDMSPDNDSPINLCPTFDNLIDTSLWILDNKTPISIEEIVGNPTLPGSQLASYEPIEVMSNSNSDEFSNLIQVNPEYCLPMLSYAELIELGYGF